MSKKKENSFLMQGAILAATALITKIIGLAYRIPVTVFVVGLSLIFTGYTSAKLGKAPTKPAMLRNLIIGLLTMGVTYFFGQLFSI